MSTFIQIQPEEHATKKTTLIRLDDDFKCTVRIEERNKTPETPQFNFSGLEEDEQLVAGQRGVADPIEYVRVVKLGTDARCIIGVKAYHLPDEADTVPPVGMYWYPWKTQVDPNELLRSAKGEPEPVASPGTPIAAPDPAFEGGASQTWETIYNIATDTTNHPIPATPRATVSFQAETRRTYELLGIDPETGSAYTETAKATEARRTYLKRKIVDILDSPNFLLILHDVYMPGNRVAQDGGQMGCGFLRYLEMMARVISIDNNLNSEQKFNLLNGDLSLDFLEFVRNFSYGKAVLLQNVLVVVLIQIIGVL